MAYIFLHTEVSVNFFVTNHFRKDIINFKGKDVLHATTFMNLERELYWLYTLGVKLLILDHINISRNITDMRITNKTSAPIRALKCNLPPF